MSTPRWARALLRWLAPPDGVDDVLGDLEEAHRRRLARSPRPLAYLRTAVDTVEMAWVLLRLRRTRRSAGRRAPQSPLAHPPARFVFPWLDLKLGVRMLVKYPGLSIVGGLGLAVAMGMGGGLFEFFHANLRPPLPLPDGDRIVSLVDWNTTINRRWPRPLLDFVVWRDEMKTMQDVGAFQQVRRNLVPPNGHAEPMAVAEMTASGFRIAGVPPLLGRPLLDADEAADAPPVVVIGYDVWRTRFGSDPQVVGKTLQLGDTRYTVVGVMPQGFGFPLNHGLWTPMRVEAAKYTWEGSPPVYVFGRLAPGATPATAQVELTALGQRAAAADPATHGHIRPRVMYYTDPLAGTDDVSTRWVVLVQMLFSLVLLIPAANVAILSYARATTRQDEIAVRTALGASRGRIIGQLFIEALLLATLAAGAGLGLAWWGIAQADRIQAYEFGQTLPFWTHPGLSLATVGYVGGLVVVATVVAGVLPGLEATSPRARAGLGRAGGATRLRLGRTWSALIVAQVGLTVAFLPLIVSEGWWALRKVPSTLPFNSPEQFLTARLALDTETPPADEASAYTGQLFKHFETDRDDLIRRLEAEPGVMAVTWSFQLLGEENRRARVEVEGRPVSPGSEGGYDVLDAFVAPGYFGAMGVPLLSGRDLGTQDAGAGTHALIVDRTFARQVLGGADAVGHRVRWVPSAKNEPGPWFEIVGVAEDLTAYPMSSVSRSAAGTVYRTVPPTGAVYPTTLLIHLSTSPQAFVPRLRRITLAVDPTLELLHPTPLDKADSQLRVGMRLMGRAMVLAALATLLLSSAAVFALMAFAVAQRRREIGIRSALGANPRRLLASIFSRALGQLGVGLVLGGATALYLATTVYEDPAARAPSVIPWVAAIMALVGVAAALGPARRGLSIEPTEALRADG